jgi:hypothetical protein
MTSEPVAESAPGRLTWLRYQGITLAGAAIALTLLVCLATSR